MQPGMFGLGRPDGALIFNTTSQDDLLAGLTGYGLTVLRNNAQMILTLHLRTAFVS